MSPTGIEFRPLRPDEQDAGYEVICTTVDQLRRERIRLWERPLLRATYAARQARGENYGLFGAASLQAIASIVTGAPEYWRDLVPGPRAPWLCTVATADGYRGCGTGRRMIDAAAAFLRDRGDEVVYLDCKPGFLELFWGALGFERIERRRIRISHGYPSGALFDAVLMRRDLRPRRAGRPHRRAGATRDVRP
jgi:GNAT superfamily N-acetyltransferase